MRDKLNTIAILLMCMFLPGCVKTITTPPIHLYDTDVGFIVIKSTNTVAWKWYPKVYFESELEKMTEEERSGISIYKVHYGYDIGHLLKMKFWSVTTTHWTSEVVESEK